MRPVIRLDGSHIAINYFSCAQVHSNSPAIGGCWRESSQHSGGIAGQFSQPDCAICCAGDQHIKTACTPMSGQGTIQKTFAARILKKVDHIATGSPARWARGFV